MLKITGIEFETSVSTIDCTLPSDTISTRITATADNTGLPGDKFDEALKEWAQKAIRIELRSNRMQGFSKATVTVYINEHIFQNSFEQL